MAMQLGVWRGAVLMNQHLFCFFIVSLLDLCGSTSGRGLVSQWEQCQEQELLANSWQICQELCQGKVEANLPGPTPHKSRGKMYGQKRFLCSQKKQDGTIVCQGLCHQKPLANCKACKFVSTEEYDRLLAEAISEGATVDHSLTFRTWKKVVGDKKKGKLYGLGNLAANYRAGSVASTLTFTLNHGEGSSWQPELTPKMRELIHRLAKEKFAQQMATQAAIVQDLLNRQRSYEEQLAQFRQAQAQDPSPVLSLNVEPYPVDRDEEEDCNTQG
ncbi:hypothetical protein MTR_5g080310 [Medicago truncatula]|uniref:Uncharacterized protein n=1 Tax=Medicago truncatula TaxID=3880 RepID=G7KGR9_MEDTR|nr:hypothetical protein MTR_5g080310 [Medicago truncatula]